MSHAIYFYKYIIYIYEYILNGEHIIYAILQLDFGDTL